MTLFTQFRASLWACSYAVMNCCQSGGWSLSAGSFELSTLFTYVFTSITCAL